METFESLFHGFSILLTWTNLSYCFLGALIGTLIGVLPGIGPVATISLLLPVTYYLNPTTAVIMVAGVYYGAMYGGSTTSILVNIPGEIASVVTCLDGYQMALKGRGGAALSIAAIGSFIGGTFGVIGLMVGTNLLGRFALRFGPPEYFSLIFLSFSMLIYLSSGSPLKAVIMAVVGSFLGTVGRDEFTGEFRFNYGSLTLMDGIGLIPVIMGIFGIGELLMNLEGEIQKDVIKAPNFKNLFPTIRDWRDSFGPILRACPIGFFLGILPGGNPATATFLSYAVERKLSKHPENFGKGAIEGVAGPETANNALIPGSFIPLFSLGIPPNIVIAIILGVFMMHGVHPGPTFIQENPDLFWGVVASMYLGNLMLLVLNLPLIGVWVRVLSVPYHILFPLILLFCVIGVYSLNYNVWDLVILAIFGFLGYLMRKFKYEGVPFAFAFFLSPIMENALRKSLLMSGGSFSILLTRPISCVLMISGSILFVMSVVPFFRRRMISTDI